MVLFGQRLVSETFLSRNAAFIMIMGGDRIE